MSQFKSPFPQQGPQQPHTGYPQWQQPPQQWYPPQPHYYQPPPQVMPPQYVPQPFYQPPPMPQPPPPKPKTLRNYIIAALVGALAVIIILSAIIEVEIQNKNSSTTPIAQATEQSQPTATPTPLPTPTDTPVPALNQAIVGGTEAAFTARFGNPASRQTEQNGAQELIYDASTSNIGQLGLVLWPGTSTVYGLVISAPTGQPWNATTAVSVCVSYLPSDSTLDHPQDITNITGAVVGLFQSGYSAQLANALSPAYFNDVSGNTPVKAGTFSIRYTYADSSGNTATLCAIRLGRQSTSA